MADKPTEPSQGNAGEAGTRIVIEQHPPRGAIFGRRFLMFLLIVSVFFNISFYVSYRDYFRQAKPLVERFHSGDREAASKLALLRCEGVLMGRETEFLLDQIKQARQDDNVAAVVLSVDSPGGLVADSQRIYHALNELRESGRPLIVAMKGLAASGGYYISMAADETGKIYAEPTTWTGSIGVLFPHYELVGLMEKIGVQYDSITTGPLKEAGTPFRPMDEQGQAMWRGIVDDAFEQFLHVVEQGRPNLKADQIREYATGAVFTAQQALERGLIDEIGYEEDAIAEATQRSGKTSLRVVTYRRPPTMLENLLGPAVQSPEPALQLRTLLELTVPRAHYLFTSTGLLPGQAGGLR